MFKWQSFSSLQPAYLCSQKFSFNIFSNYRWECCILNSHTVYQNRFSCATPIVLQKFNLAGKLHSSVWLELARGQRKCQKLERNLSSLVTISRTFLITQKCWEFWIFIIPTYLLVKVRHTHHIKMHSWSLSTYAIFVRHKIKKIWQQFHGGDQHYSLRENIIF